MAKKEFIIKIKKVLIAAAVLFIGSEIVGIAMYNYHVRNFFDDDTFPTYQIHSNGVVGISNMISVTDIIAYEPAANGSTVHEICRDVTSERGFPTLSFVGDTGVCCNTAKNQWLLPFKDEADTRYYLCGKWPFLETVSQPIALSKHASN